MAAETEATATKDVDGVTKKKQSDAVEKENHNAQKNFRKRKRHFYNKIRAQMEFYFGDANLSKDRFLRQLIDKDPFVCLDVFLTFNKMKSLTSSVEEIAKSLSNSELLELDETQTKVRRKTALPEERNVDEKTLYVESLPPTADHDWVRQVFERFGAVNYVSLPKFTKSRKIKEFGFVEFAEESSIMKAINAFKEFNGVLNMEAVDPSEIRSVKAYLKEQKAEAKNKLEGQVDETKKAKKRSNTTKEITDGPKSKKAKVEESEDSSASETETAADTETNEENGDASDDEDKKKKRRRRKKKSKNAAHNKKTKSSVDTTASYYELKILPKRDWKRLRNKYLNLQREKIVELKRKAWKERQQQSEQQAKENAADMGDCVAAPPAKKTKPNERKLQKMNMNFYGAGEDESPQTKMLLIKDTKTTNVALERAPLFSYEPGVIVEVGFMEPCVHIKEFKTEMRQYATVKYVDVKEGAMYAYVRLDNASATDDFVRRVGCAEYKCQVLTGDAETEYWKKIESDREMKLNKQVKVPQKRGREKIKKLVAKHIRFGDDVE